MLSTAATMSSDISKYIASRYLVADSKPKAKKRKRKDKDITSGLVIKDDGETDIWGTANNLADEDGDTAPLILENTTVFRKTTKSSWKTLEPRNAIMSNDDKDGTAAADAIIASTVAEQQSARDADEDAPILDDPACLKMSDGTHAGLQSAKSVSAQLNQRQRKELAEFERHRKSEKEGETVYRDATGRRIDISAKRAEIRRMAAEKEEGERRKIEALKGDVQLLEAKKRREQLEDIQVKSFARTVDDEDMNQELRIRERWNDPMMQFASEKKQKDGSLKGNRRAPAYNGAASPNRYGIKPGYRWDGVDRGNGFEGERFKTINRKERIKGLEYSWQMDE